MVKKILFLFSFTFILIIPLSIMKISSSNPISLPVIIMNKDDSIGNIQIDKINVKEPFYSIDNPKNTIDQHVSILKESIPPTEENSILILAAHSGTTDISFFNDLNQLGIKDEIKITYLNEKYIYQVKEIWREKKNGFIHIKKEDEKQLILTTCDPIEKEYQIIVSCIEKES